MAYSFALMYRLLCWSAR